MTAPTAAGAPRPAPRPRSVSGLGAELALCVMVIASSCAYGRVFLGGEAWAGPIIGTGLGAVLVCSITRRLIPSAIVGAIVDLAGVVLLAIWTVIPATTDHGLPLGRTWRYVDALIGGLNNQVAATLPPTRPMHSFILVTAAGVGLMSALSSWLALRIGRRGWAIAPMLLVFLVASILGTPAERAASVAIAVAGIGVWVVVERAERERDPRRWVGGRRPRSQGGVVRLGVRVVVLCTIASLLIAGLFRSADGHGVLGWHPDSAAPTRIIVTPIVSLATRLDQESHRNVFTVTSPVPSYWQLTTLDVYSGSTWQTGRASYNSFSTALPGPGVAIPPGTRRVVETIHIQGLDSPWLPVAFTPIAVSGTSGVQYNATTASLLTEHTTSNGLTYTVTSYQYLATLDPAKLAGAPPVTAADLPEGSLALPSDVPGDVYQLAAQLTHGLPNEYAKARALQDYFHQAMFHYTLHPESDGSGVAAISNFLFATHAGYCQQFAGAFSVMARSVGLPTRLAIGFTTGTPIGSDTYQVTDANVHTWPEVWFPRYGWVPFEPTKGAAGQGFAIPGTERYAGDTAGVTHHTHTHTRPPTGSSGSTTTPTTSPVTTPAPGTTTPTPSANQPHGGGPGGQGRLHEANGSGGGTAAGAPTAGSHTWILWIPVALALALALLITANLTILALRRRSRRRRARDPSTPSTAALLLGWDEIAVRLAAGNIVRHRSETLAEFAGRAGRELETSARSDGSDERELGTSAGRAGSDGRGTSAGRAGSDGRELGTSARSAGRAGRELGTSAESDGRDGRGLGTDQGRLTRAAVAVDAACWGGVDAIGREDLLDELDRLAELATSARRRLTPLQRVIRLVDPRTAWRRQVVDEALPAPPAPVPA